jgi:cytolysin (calcineurin-like family phosphatase)
MHRRYINLFFATVMAAILVSTASFHTIAQSPIERSPIGIFDDHGDIGVALHPGTSGFDRATGAYTVTGSGANMWFGEDDFHFVWKKVSGDVAISANISFVGTKGDNHRKAVLMIRQSLDADSAAVDVECVGAGTRQT